MIEQEQDHQDHQDARGGVEEAEGTPTPTEPENGPENGAHEPEEGGVNPVNTFPREYVEKVATRLPPARAAAFPREYVEKLRAENAGYRQRAARADEYADALWESRVAASGRLADPTDLPMPEGTDPLDVDAVTGAVEDLLARKPHLASRVPRGDIGQGATATPEAVDLAAILRAGAS